MYLRWIAHLCQQRNASTHCFSPRRKPLEFCWHFRWLYLEVLAFQLKELEAGIARNQDCGVAITAKRKLCRTDDLSKPELQPACLSVSPVAERRFVNFQDDYFHAPLRRRHFQAKLAANGFQQHFGFKLTSFLFPFELKVVTVR